jgi:hypothetical protein
VPASSRGENALKDRRSVTALPVDAHKLSWADRSQEIAQAGPLTSGLRNFLVADGLFCQEKRDLPHSPAPFGHLDHQGGRCSSSVPV